MGTMKPGWSPIQDLTDDEDLADEEAALQLLDELDRLDVFLRLSEMLAEEKKILN